MSRAPAMQAEPGDPAARPVQNFHFLNVNHTRGHSLLTVRSRDCAPNLRSVLPSRHRSRHL